MQLFNVFFCRIRPFHSVIPWEGRLVAAQSVRQAEIAVRLERMVIQSPPTKCGWLNRSRCRLFAEIEEGFFQAWNDVEEWRQVGFEYLVKRPDQVLMPLAVTTDPREVDREAGVIVYHLRDYNHQWLAAFRLAHQRYREARPLLVRVPSRVSDAAE